VPNLGRIASEMAELQLFFDFALAPIETTLPIHHRLNGSSSPVLTATSLSYGKAKNSTPCRIKTPDLIEIKFGKIDYVGEMTPHAKFRVNPSNGGFPANG